MLPQSRVISPCAVIKINTQNSLRLAYWQTGARNRYSIFVKWKYLVLSIKSVIALSRQVLAETREVLEYAELERRLYFLRLLTHCIQTYFLPSLPTFYFLPMFVDIVIAATSFWHAQVDQSSCHGVFILLSGYLFAERRTCVVRTVLYVDMYTAFLMTKLFVEASSFSV